MKTSGTYGIYDGNGTDAELLKNSKYSHNFNPIILESKKYFFFFVYMYFFIFFFIYNYLFVLVKMKINSYIIP